MNTTRILSRRTAFGVVPLALAGLLAGHTGRTQAYPDNETLYANQDPDIETRRSDRLRLCFGHFNRDTGAPMTEQLAQGNLQMYEQMWQRWVVEMGLHDLNESATRPDGRSRPPVRTAGSTAPTSTS